MSFAIKLDLAMPSPIELDLAARTVRRLAAHPYASSIPNRALVSAYRQERNALTTPAEMRAAVLIEKGRFTGLKDLREADLYNVLQCVESIVLFQSQSGGYPGKDDTTTK